MLHSGGQRGAGGEVPMAATNASVHCDKDDVFLVYPINNLVCIEVRGRVYGGSATFMTPDQAGQLANAITGYLLALEVAADAAQVLA